MARAAKKRVGVADNMNGKKWSKESPMKGMKASKRKGLITETGNRSTGAYKKVKLNVTDGMPKKGFKGLPEKTQKELQEEANKLIKEYLADMLQSESNFWEAKCPYDRKKVFETPSIMLQAAAQYFVWNQHNPWYKYEWKDSMLVRIPVGRPLTLEGLTAFIGTHTEFFNNFERNLKKSDPQYADYIRVIRVIREAIRRQKFEGAAVGAFNANLIGYDLGLRKDVQQLGSGGSGLNIIVEERAYEKLLEDTKRLLESLDDIDGTESAQKLAV